MIYSEGIAVFTWKEIEKQAVKEHTQKAGRSDFRNRLLGCNISTYSIYHHYGLGKVKNLSTVLKRKYSKEMKKLIYKLEKAEADYLIGLLKGCVNETSEILDCGSGSGGTAFDLFNQYGCNVTGISIAAKQVKFTNKLAAMRKITRKVKFLKMNMRDLKFATNHFDAAITNETTMYVDLNNFYQGLSRVIKKSGKYAMISWCRADNHVRNNKYADQIDTHYIVKMHSLKVYKKALARNNFKILQFKDLTREGIDYWKLRKASPISSDVDAPFLEGLKKGYIKYFSILAEVKK